MVVDEDSSDFSLSHLSLLPFLCFHLHCHSLNCPALRSCDDVLTTRLPLHLVNPSCPLGFSMKPSLVLTGRHCPCSHASDIHHSCLLRGTGFELEPTVWKAPSHRRQNVGEKFTWKADRDSVAHRVVSSAYWIFAEWKIIFIEVNWKDPEVSGFFWLLFTPLLPMLT